MRRSRVGALGCVIDVWGKALAGFGHRESKATSARPLYAGRGRSSSWVSGLGSPAFSLQRRLLTLPRRALPAVPPASTLVHVCMSGPSDADAVGGTHATHRSHGPHIHGVVPTLPVPDFIRQ
jgi:hypothetical protein